MTDRPRLLLIGPPINGLNGELAAAADVEPISSDPAEVARRLHDGGFAAVVAAPDVVAGLLDRFRRDELIISHIDKGLAVLDAVGVILWANPVFRAATNDEPVGRTLLDALGGDRVSIEHVEAAPTGGPVSIDSADPLGPARRGAATVLRVHRPTNSKQPFLEIDVRPVFAPDGDVSGLTALVRNVTFQVVQQQKLDALHAAGRELAGLDTDQLTDMNVEARVELLKANLRRTIHDLLHYDTIEVRLLDRTTRRAEAAARRRHATGGRGPRAVRAADRQRRDRVRRRDRRELPVPGHGPRPALHRRRRRRAQLDDGPAQVPGRGDRHAERRKPARRRVRPGRPAVHRTLQQGDRGRAAHARPVARPADVYRRPVDRVGEQGESRCRSTRCWPARAFCSNGSPRPTRKRRPGCASSWPRRGR